MTSTIRKRGMRTYACWKTVWAGDPTLFTRSDAVDESWTYFDKILDYWKKHPETPLYGYPAGTWGPKEADVLINRSHAEWTNPCKNLTHSNLYCKL